MLQRYTHGEITWIDLESPDRDEVRSLIEEFDIDALVADELLLPTAKPRLDVYNDYLYTILHFPALRHTHKTQEQEVDFIIGRNFIITTRYDTIDPLHKFSKVFEVNSITEQSNIGDHAGFVFYYMLKKMYKSAEHEIEFIRDALEDAEEQIFEGNEKEMVEALSNVGRDLLNMRQALEPHRDVLRSLESAGKEFFGDAFVPYLKAMTNEYHRVHNHIMRHMESLRELRETNNSLLSTKQNEVMKILTIIAFTTFPLTLVASVFGMNAENMPFVGHKYDFWIVIIIMATATALMFSYFKHKKWL